MNQASSKPLAKALHTVTVVTKIALALRSNPFNEAFLDNAEHMTARALGVLGYTSDPTNPVQQACQKAVEEAISRLNPPKPTADPRYADRPRDPDTLVRFGSEGQPVQYDDAADASEHRLNMMEGRC